MAPPGSLGTAAIRLLLNIVWLVLAGLCGWWLVLGHLITGIAEWLTIIGIPLGLANFKLIPISLLPLGREVVSVEEARAMGFSPDIRVP